MVLLLVKAPTLETPVPLMVNASVATDVSEKPFISKLAPEETVVAPETSPKGPVADDDETPNFKVPTLTVVNPVYVLTPDKVNVPAPDLVIPPVPEITPVVIAAAFAPSTVNKKPPFIMFPVKVRPPEPEDTMVEAAVSVIGMDKDAAVVLELSKTPDDDTPVPARSIRSQVAIDCALTSNAPPEATCIILVAEPVQVPVT